MKVSIGKKVVASQNQLATYVGAKILETGGNAFDAAVGVSAVLSVVLPYTSGLGGDGFLLANTPEGLIAYNASGWTSKNLKIQKIPSPRHPSTVLVPGLVDMWDYIERKFMSLDLQTVLQPAVKLATNGFYIGKELGRAISRAIDMPESWSKLYKGRMAGDFIKLRELGEALKVISRNPREFYEGKLMEEIVLGLNKQGVEMEFSDFANFRGEEVKPIKSTYRDFTLYELPPNSQGITTLEILKLSEMVETWKHKFDDIERVKEMVKIFAIGYNDRDRYVTDPRFYSPEINLLDENVLRVKLREMGILPNRILRTEDTTFFVVADGENEVGFIQSLFFHFGSGITVKQFPFNNRGFGFTEGNNKPEPRKRPLHTLSILYAEKDDESLFIGCAGGDLRPQIHAEVFQYYADYNMEIDEAVNAPRFILLSDKIVAEKRLNLPFQQLDYFTPEVGVVQALKRKSDRYYAVADLRSEGVSLSVQ
ncbi:gamma-glutamyltransferase family protein [Sulfolobus acidocaldarius]|uniref:Gamma-glutamyltranspeptidase n=4 Tax=Sulfolobus acidocaldarius TaxID=2285 RepID=Q4JBJ1_SULAC|nr:gamma-glutamyltransferase [Sulfolobus acidocaldarius]AAY79838.1 gamma-glutamyltranspeptidase [Sulfolobus acidocaldarius DSM 639]AGE70399.1 gamma-glutamyltransferase [Sulfolobus acidocaldarius N8]AGE72673.1 gamma-glutamyltransferase [Sulfolobus acidocaldarius Ron12/I]ALU29209.1 gamma-glutamyltransferase [Sulfolobus acidocaldarius]ALU31936.1 gamma-glutamyltransferase [Sulfolobus acidocaldarius]